MATTERKAEVMGEREHPEHVTDQLERRAIRIGRVMAAQRGMLLPQLFDAALRGDVARLQVRRALRKAMPGSTAEERDRAITVALSEAWDDCDG